MIEEIAEELDRSDADHAPRITRDRVEVWMLSELVDEMGTVYAFLMEPSAAARVTPPIPSSMVTAFLRRYFERCIKEDPDSEWADSRYSAGWDLARFLLTSLRGGALDDRDLLEWVRWLANAYKKGDEEIKTAIEAAVLEHILATPRVVDAFVEWRADSELKTALDRSLANAHPFDDLG